MFYSIPLTSKIEREKNQMAHGTRPKGDMESGLKINNNKPGLPLAGLNCIYLSVTLALRTGPSLVLVCRVSLEVIFTR